MGIGLGGPDRKVNVSGSSLGTDNLFTMVTGMEAAPDDETTREDAWEAAACVKAGASAKVWVADEPRVGAGLKVSVCTEVGTRSEADDDAGAKVSV